MSKHPLRHHLTISLVLLSLLVTACEGNVSAGGLSSQPASTEEPSANLWTGRPNYEPGEWVDYIAQSGDTLPALAVRFNTNVDEIRQANPIIPQDATTMPPGMPMKIPIYYLPLWGEQFQSIPDNAFVYGPSLVGFNTSAFVASKPGWLKSSKEWAGAENRTGATTIDYVAQNFSISPRLLLALLEYQGGALSDPYQPDSKYMLGHKHAFYEGMYLQLVWAANLLNHAYYNWRLGKLTEFELADGSLYRPDPWQNAASVALQYYFAQIYPVDEFRIAIGPEGLARTYEEFFGDPWQDLAILIPGSLQQPSLRFPFPADQVWTYTGGPHTGWGTLEPYAGIDFAPPAEQSGCFRAAREHYATAMADGIVVRSDTGLVVLDLDGDGDERTGWVIVYLHVATEGRAPLGSSLKTGDPVGYPSCEGGRTTGTHIHVSRKYNGEWLPAGNNPLAFNIEGWVVHNGKAAYQGTMTRGGLVVTACDCSDAASRIWSEISP